MSGFPRNGDSCAGGIGPRHGVEFPAELNASLLSWIVEKASPSLVQPRKRCIAQPTTTLPNFRADLFVFKDRSFRVHRASSLPTWFTTVESHGIPSLSCINWPISSERCCSECLTWNICTFCTFQLTRRHILKSQTQWAWR
jgi:hypothetical protein